MGGKKLLVPSRYFVSFLSVDEVLKTGGWPMLCFNSRRASRRSQGTADISDRKIIISETQFEKGGID